MESGEGGVVGESRRELLGSDTIADARQPSWRLNLDEFRLPERESDHRHPTFNIRRLIRHKSMYLLCYMCLRAECLSLCVDSLLIPEFSVEHIKGTLCKQISHMNNV